MILAGHFPHPGFIVKEAGSFRFTLPS